MLKKLIKKELVSLKRLGFKDKYHIQRLQQMLDKEITLERWQASGQMMPLGEYKSLYNNLENHLDMVSQKNKDVFRYAGGLAIELTPSGLYYSKVLNRMHADIVNLEKELYNAFKD